MQTKEKIVPTWVIAVAIVVASIWVATLAHKPRPAIGNNASAASSMPGYCADGYHDAFVECGWTPERQRQKEVAEQQRAYEESGAWSSDNKYSAWRCDETPVSQLTVRQTNNCESLVGRR